MIDFYEIAGFDAGVSVDHVIPIFDSQSSDSAIPRKWKRRLRAHASVGGGVPRNSFRRRDADSSRSALLRAGAPAPMQKRSLVSRRWVTSRIALGGLVPLKSHEILAVARRSKPSPALQRRKLHLFGVTVARCCRSSVTTGLPASTARRHSAKRSRTTGITTTLRDGSVRCAPRTAGGRNAKLQARIRAG